MFWPPNDSFTILEPQNFKSFRSLVSFTVAKTVKNSVERDILWSRTSPETSSTKRLIRGGDETRKQRRTKRATKLGRWMKIKRAYDNLSITDKQRSKFHARGGQFRNVNSSMQYLPQHSCNCGFCLSHSVYIVDTYLYVHALGLAQKKNSE